ncbi:MAG: ATP-binding cassette domain-containing protein, partial [Actinomycetota bacterium]
RFEGDQGIDATSGGSSTSPPVASGSTTSDEGPATTGPGATTTTTSPATTSTTTTTADTTKTTDRVVLTTGHSATVRVDDVSYAVDDRTLLHPTSLSIDAGEIVGIAGGSGAGKTTLVEIIAGVRNPSSGRVQRHDVAAFVPQDDIIHRELPLRQTLLHTAALRMAGADAHERTAAVDHALRRLDLDTQRNVAVGDLSGGQRKRASLAAEMLTDPSLCVLDEPTSGLDPANAAELMRALRRLADGGSTVVVATHSPADLTSCDRVVFIARGGHVAFVGRPVDAPAHFGVNNVTEVYERLNDWPASGDEVSAVEATAPTVDAPTATGSTGPRQWLGLVRRNIDLIKGNRLTLSILVGSPVFIIGTMTFLFPTGAFDGDAPTIDLAIQTLFWMAFNSFFFGLTYGLLQVVGEFEIVRRERRAGLRIGAYVASKLAVLLPMLAAVNIAQITMLEAAGRLPDMDIGQWVGVFVSLQLLSTAAVVLGLHASSAVHNASQATLALPMLCFPQVLFAGAVVPVSQMGWFAEAMSVPLAVRWAFEPLGNILELGPRAAQEASTAGFAEAFDGHPGVGWTILVALIAGGTVGTIRTLQRRTATR